MSTQAGTIPWPIKMSVHPYFMWSILTDILYLPRRSLKALLLNQDLDSELIYQCSLPAPPQSRIGRCPFSLHL